MPNAVRPALMDVQTIPARLVVTICVSPWCNLCVILLQLCTGIYTAHIYSLLIEPINAGRGHKDANYVSILHRPENPVSSYFILQILPAMLTLPVEKQVKIDQKLKRQNLCRCWRPDPTTRWPKNYVPIEVHQLGKRKSKQPRTPSLCLDSHAMYIYRPRPSVLGREPCRRRRVGVVVRTRVAVRVVRVDGRAALVLGQELLDFPVVHPRAD